MLSTDNSVPLCRHFNRAMLTLAAEDLPNGFDVMKNAPATLPELVSHYRSTGRIAVEETGSGGCTMGNPAEHYAFRAWHDLAHVKECGAFNVAGERLLARDHQVAILDRFGFNAATLWLASLVEIEIVAQNIIAETTGAYPADPRAFALCWLGANGIERPAERAFAGL